MQVVFNSNRFHKLEDCPMLEEEIEVTKTSKKEALDLGLKPCFCTKATGLETQSGLERGIERLFNQLRKGIEDKRVQAEDLFRLQKILHFPPEGASLAGGPELLRESRQSFNENTTFTPANELRKLIFEAATGVGLPGFFEKEVAALKHALGRQKQTPVRLERLWLKNWASKGDPKRATQATLQANDHVRSSGNSNREDTQGMSFVTYEASIIGCQILEAWTECLEEDLAKKADCLILLDRNYHESIETESEEKVWGLFAKNPSIFRYNLIAMRVSYDEALWFRELLRVGGSYNEKPILIFEDTNDDWEKSLETMMALSGVPSLFEDAEVYIGGLDGEDIEKMEESWGPAKALESKD